MRNLCVSLAAMLGSFAGAAVAATLGGAAHQPAAAPAARAPTVTAAPSISGYMVEVLVFRSSGGTGSGEDLTHVSTRGLRADSSADVPVDTDSPRAATDNVRLLQVMPSASLKLNDIKNRLNSSGAYRVVAHTAWTQTAANWGSRAGLSTEQLGLTDAGITGIVYLERGQYLHLGLDLAYGDSGGTYTLSEMRRVRYNERNYYDHPAFGVIAVVSQVGARR